MKFIPLLLLLTFQLAQARNVTHLAESDVDYFRAVNSNSGYSNSSEALFLLMIFEASSGGGTAESSPHKTYVPLNDQSANLTDAEKQLENNVLSNSVTSLPGVTAADNLEVILRTLISVDEDSTSTEIHVLMENNSGNWAKVSSTAVTYDGGARNWRLTIDLNTVCTEISTTECENIKNNSESGKEEIVSFYVLSSTGTFNLGQEYDPATYTGGIFYDVYLSDKVPTGNLTLTNLERGDGRLTITVSGGSSITNMTDPIIFRSYVFDGATGSTEVQSAGGTTIQTDSPVRDGDIVVKNLSNGTTYTLSTALVNKYQFSSKTSTTSSGEPLEIQALLESQACYLVSAGFQKEHYVLDYFRSIRDNYLMKFAPTKKFVDFYYATAPAYAPVIYKSPKLSLIVRSLSYGVYFLLKFFWYILGFGLIVLAIRFKNFRINLAS